MNPQETLKRAQEGDSRARALLYTEYFTPVFRYAYIRTRNKETAQDIAQTVFLKFYSALGTLKKDTRILPLLFTIARNTLIDAGRKNKKNVDGISEEEFENIEDPHANTGREAENSLLKKLIVEGMALLSEEQQEVIVLRIMEEHSTEHVAEKLGKTEEAVRQIQSRALRKLREFFKAHAISI